MSYEGQRRTPRAIRKLICARNGVKYSGRQWRRLRKRLRRTNKGKAYV